MVIFDAILVVLVAALLYLFLKLAINYARFRTHPLRNDNLGPTDGGFLWGQFWVIRREPFMEPHLRWIRQLGGDWNMPFLYYTLVFGRPSVLILDKEIVRQILTASYGKRPLRFVKEIGFMRNVLGDGLVTLQGPNWMRHRSIIQPAFLTQALKETLTSLVPPLTRELVMYWKTAEGREIDVASHLSALTLDIIGKGAFSHEFHALQSVERWSKAAATNRDSSEDASDVLDLDDPLLHAFRSSFTFTWVGTVAFILEMPWISRWFNRSTIETRRVLDEGVDQIVARAKRKDNTTVDKNARNSLLQILMDAHDGDSSKKHLDDMELRDEVKTFIFAGHETTQTWCYQAIFALCKYPDIQEKVYQDVLRHTKMDETFTLEIVEEMEYFSAFLQEVLRMFPPIGMIPRSTADEGESFGTKYKISKGTRLVIPVYLLHRHPKYWTDPDTFRPERWIFNSYQERETFMSNIRFAFLPFSAGSRNCIGQRFATIEAKLIMAELIRSFVFRVAPSQSDANFTMSNIVALKTKPRLKVVVKARSLK